MECLDEEAKKRAAKKGKEASKKAEIISSLRPKYKFEDLLKIANIKRSTYFYHVSKINVLDKYSYLKQCIKQIFDEHKGRYGYRRITLALRNIGILANNKLVRRLMNILGLKSNVRPKKYRSYKGAVGEIADNILKRDFKSNKPNSKWVTDITEFKVKGEKLYLSTIMDLFNGEIIAHSTDNKPVFGMVKNMFEKALKTLNQGEKPIVHSDQGWHYQMKWFYNKIKELGLKQSMSRKGNCLDNAAMESFFAILKTEAFYGYQFNSIQDLQISIDDYINYYNNHRIKTSLKGLSPVQYRAQLFP